jgi:hypothetical protein
MTNQDGATWHEQYRCQKCLDHTLHRVVRTATMLRYTCLVCGLVVEHKTG